MLRSLRSKSGIDMKIDVIIPTYNSAHFITEAISSVQTQTYAPEQIIIVDDGSTDDTESIISDLRHASTVPLMYIKKENGGPNSARNVGLAHATAELVAFLDADDRWEPTKLAQQVALFEQDIDGTLGLVYGNYKVIDTAGADRPDIPTVPINPRIRGNAFEALLPKNMILGSASNVLIRRSVFETVGPFDETLRVGEDWDMWLRIAEKFQINYVDQALVAIRRHSQNQTSNRLFLIKGDIVFIEKWVPRIEGTYSIPEMWSDRIVFNIIRGFPHLDGLRLAQKTLSKNVRKKLFKSTNGSLVLACIFSPIRVLADNELRPQLLRAIKRYVTR